MLAHIERERHLEIGHVRVTMHEGVPQVARDAVYPPELDVEHRTVLSPEKSLRRIESASLKQSSRMLLGKLIERGRVLDWRHLGIGYALDYSRILNRQLDIEGAAALARDHIEGMLDAGVNCILAPDNSGGPIAALFGMLYYERTFRNPLFVRLLKSPALTMDHTVGVKLASYTRVENAQPSMSTMTADVGDFPQGIPLRAALCEDIFDTGAIAIAAKLITEQLNESGVNIRLVSAVAPFAKTYAGNMEVLQSLGISHIGIGVEVEGLKPMTADSLGLIQVAGIPEILSLSRTDMNGQSH